MKPSRLSVSVFLALLASAQALPAATIDTQSTALTPAEQEQITVLIQQLDSHVVTRALITDNAKLHARAYAIVTQILAAINCTNLALKIIQGLVDNENLQPMIIQSAILIIKSGLIPLNTLFTVLNEFGLATTVIYSLVSDCTSYQDILKLMLIEISNLVQKIEDKLAGKSVSARGLEDVVAVRVDTAKRYDSDSVVNQLLESLVPSGLASSVVRALVVDPQFLKYGASLLKELFDQNLINFKALIEALFESGLVTPLFKESFNVPTLKTVILNSLAADFNQCGGKTISGTPTGNVTQITTTTVLPNFKATGTTLPTGKCKRRRKRRLYN